MRFEKKYAAKNCWVDGRLARRPYSLTARFTGNFMPCKSLGFPGGTKSVPTCEENAEKC